MPAKNDLLPVSQNVWSRLIEWSATRSTRLSFFIFSTLKSHLPFRQDFPNPNPNPQRLREWVSEWSFCFGRETQKNGFLFSRLRHSLILNTKGSLFYQPHLSNPNHSQILQWPPQTPQIPTLSLHFSHFSLSLATHHQLRRQGLCVCMSLFKSNFLYILFVD